MSLTVLLLVLFCGLTLAQYGEGEVTFKTQYCFPDMCKVLQELGAMKEKQRAMEAKLQQTETKLQQTETKLQQTEIKMKETENQVVEQKCKGTTKVVFSTAVDTNGAYGPFDTDTTLIYRNVILNVGSAYNQNTGIFTAPVAGVYYFSFFYHAGGQHRSNLHLYKNFGVMAITYDHHSESDQFDNGGNAVFLQLQQGDQVFVKLIGKSHVWGNNQYTTFSGFLVTET